MRALLARFTYANVVASTALFIALGGAGYAAVQLPQNSVTTRAIEKGAVTGDRLADNAVTSAKVRAGSLVGTDLDMKRLGTVPAARVAGGIAKVTYKLATASGPGYSGSGTLPSAFATARCGRGQGVIGGGAQVESEAAEFVNDSHPAGTSGWTAVVFNTQTVPHAMTTFAICVPVGTARGVSAG